MATKKLSAAQQAKNAIKWIDNLTRYKKTTGVLGRHGRYCCLGAACRIMKMEPSKGDWSLGNDSRLISVLGLNDADGGFRLVDGYSGIIEGDIPVYSLVNMNDDLYPEDAGFKNVKAFIIKHAKRVFRPSVSKLVAKHYASK